MVKKTILVVDDEKETLNVIEGLLKPEGYFIIKVFDGKECLEKLKKNSVDLVLLDFFMPGMSGREVLEKIRNDPKLKNTKVAFITVVSFSPEGKQQIENLGISDHIKKPFEHKDLIRRIHKILQQDK